jgi:glycosyltransferase involved in cell wall biosynthesis
MSDRPLAFVVQRYGEEFVGGSESLCRVVAEMLARDRPVEVLTTCAKEYTTWKNEYEPGISMLNGVRVHRFAVDFERDHRFHRTLHAILGGMPLTSYPQNRTLMRQIVARSSVEQQRSCLKLQGPYSTSLLEYLASHHKDYDLVVFFTYLYPTTFYGSQQVPPHKLLLIPTAHDEAPIHFPVFREMFARFPAHVFLTPEERRFVEETFDLGDTVKATIGMPVELAYEPDSDRFRKKYQADGPFMLYAGRLDPSKGCEELLGFYQAARPHLPPESSLILIGNRAMKVPRDRRIRHLGMLPERDKLDAMAAASVVLNPSPFESFSIVILEAMLCGTPVLVNGQSDVLRGHVRRSSAGLYYGDYMEFVEAARLMLEDEHLRSRMGSNGAEYVMRNYSHGSVKQRYLALLQQLEQASSARRAH